MSTPREKEASEYLKNHKIEELLHNLTSMLFFYRPERPREYLISQLEQLKASRVHEADSPSLFDDSNLDAVLGILDPTNQGSISYVQYKEALITLGIRNFNEHPDGLGNDRISHETFRKEACHNALYEAIGAMKRNHHKLKGRVTVVRTNAQSDYE